MMSDKDFRLFGYARPNGAKGIRNKLLILYTVNCSFHIASQIAGQLRRDGQDVDLVGNESCYDNQTMINQLLRLVTHPNVGAVLIAAYGCEFLQADKIAAYAASHGRPAQVLYGQRLGTAAAIQAGLEIASGLLDRLKQAVRVPIPMGSIALGVIPAACNGAGGALPERAVRLLDRLRGQGASLLLGATPLCSSGQVRLYSREDALSPEALSAVLEKVRKISDLYSAPPCWRAAGPSDPVPVGIDGIVKLCQRPGRPGDTWLVDDVQDAQLERGFRPIGVAGYMLDLICCGAQIIVAMVGQGTTVGAAVAPVMKLRAPSGATAGFEDDTDLVLDGPEDKRFFALLCQVINGQHTAAERLGHREAVISQNIQISCQGGPAYAAMEQ